MVWLYGKVVEPFPAPLASLAGKKVFLGPATLRPETMYESTLTPMRGEWPSPVCTGHVACRVDG